jgi:hypothetical protein
MSYSAQTIKLSDAIYSLQQEINLLIADKDKYSQKKEASEKFIYYKKQQIKSLQNVLLIFKDFQEQTNAEFLNQEKTLALANDKIIKLEGVCLLHGIHDINTYLNRTSNQITDMVLDAWKEGWRQTPIAILYNTEDRPEYKTVSKPLYDINQLKPAK